MFLPVPAADISDQPERAAFIAQGAGKPKGIRRKVTKATNNQMRMRKRGGCRDGMPVVQVEVEVLSDCEVVVVFVSRGSIGSIGGSKQIRKYRSQVP